MNLLNPKTLILTQIKEQIKNTGIVKIVLIFGIDNSEGEINSIKNENYTIMFLNKQGEKANFDIEPSEINLIKSLFIKKVLKEYEKNNTEKISSIIIQVEPYKNEGEINIFFELEKDKSLIKFEI